jgi:hypothetical protein
MRSRIAKFQQTVPELLTVKEYCALKGCCVATAYKDLRRIPGLGVRVGWNTYIRRDIALPAITQAEEPQPWAPPQGPPPGKFVREQPEEAQP